MSQCPASTAHQQTKANNKPPPSSVGFSLRHRNSRRNRRCLANAPVRSLLHRTPPTEKRPSTQSGAPPPFRNAGVPPAVSRSQQPEQNVRQPCAYSRIESLRVPILLR